MIKRLDINDNCYYEYNSDDSWEKDGKTHEFISIKKITTFKNNKRYQTLTVKHTDWEEFKKWILNIIEPVPF